MIRAARALSAAAFLFFLLYSTPHRVHHFFEQTQAASHQDGHDHGDRDRRKTPLNESTCVFQASINRCAIGPTAQIQPLTLTQSIQGLVVSKETPPLRQFLSGAFQIRAPPTA
jgi:hypothetical protein